MALRTAVLRHIQAPVGTLASAATKSTQGTLRNFLRSFSSQDDNLAPIFQKVDLSKVDNENDTVLSGSSTKICIAIRSFENKYPEDVMALPPNTRKIRLPTSRSLYTVLRSPHIDKKSREQFDMQIRRKLLTIKCRSSELARKFFWLKRQRLFGAQFEVRFFTKTRLEKDKLQSLLQGSL